MRQSWRILGGLGLVLAAIGATRARAGAPQGPITVRVEAAPGGGFRLVRGGQPYFIRGGGLDRGSPKLLAESGGNSVRTWGADGLGAILDEAQRLGLTVTAGIWLGHKGHGFRYDDPAQVAAQREAARAVITRFKDHPALLLWGIGNEMEGDGRDEAVWLAVNEIAVLAHQLDPNHPTMTVVSEFEPIKIQNLHRLCPAIDVVGLNSYGPALTVAERYRQAGGVKPYVLTEFGPAGQWELPKTPWGAAPELTSTAKAAVYRRIYETSVLHQPLCLGSYAFLWGHKQEATATWFGLQLPDGSRTGAVDTLSELWTGRPPANRCPTVEPLTLEGEPVRGPGATVRVRAVAADPDGDPIRVTWVLRTEGRYGAGGAEEAVPREFPAALVESDATHAVVRLPEAPGGYRLFLYVRDDHGGAATANVPLAVEAPR